ncbi:ABC transporter permease subunit [Cohnella sp. CFH 77786]|uniref:amino acid ABC transporter permease n=1 Tax=Cohnella sp. CFH 77786 TaxID=2662265 RepID=UPI001C609ABE|nr:amino acid ABC transporter permease [Cohnella sp. CFH 77786]MBW5449278.1 ABC transporter permease subunit [Cohnella sp. CFH 77786]
MEQPFDIGYVFHFIPKLLSTLGTTLSIVAGSLLLGLAVGLLAALPRLYRVPVLQRVSRLYVSFFRGTPILIQLFLLYFGLPELLKQAGADISKTPVIVFVILTYGLHAGASVCEMIRAAVTAVDRGQVEAAYAVGMTGYRAFTRIVFPQAIAIALPVFSNLLLALTKETSLAFTLGVMEMTGKAQSLTTLTQHFLEAYLALALVYFAVCFTMEKLLLRAERRLLKHERQESEARKRFRSWKKLQWRRYSPEFPPGGRRQGYEA